MSISANNIIEDCDIKNRLGKGSYGVVYACGKKGDTLNTIMQKPSGKKFVVKFIKQGAKRSINKIADDEFSILTKLFYKDDGSKVNDAWRNENIVKFYKLTAGEESELNNFYDTLKSQNSNVGSTSVLYKMFKFEYCNIDLYNFLTKNLHLNISPKSFKSLPFDPNQQRLFDFRKQVFNGLYYLFQQRIVHYDIKPDNILVSYETTLSGKIVPTYKIGDFGFAFNYNFNGNIDTLYAGTEGYMPLSKSNDRPFYVYPLYYTTYMRDIFAFFICIDVFFNINDEDRIFRRYDEKNTPGGVEYNKYFKDFKGEATSYNNYQSSKSDIELTNPVNDLTEEQYIKLYEMMKHDFSEDVFKSSAIKTTTPATTVSTTSTQRREWVENKKAPMKAPWAHMYPPKSNKGSKGKGSKGKTGRQTKKKSGNK
jgi:serine/threonine protein kinase